MRRAVPLLIAALLALPASASAAPRFKVHPTDAAATKALVRAVNKLERCATPVYDYMRCRVPHTVTREVRFETVGSEIYRVRATSRQRRTFWLDRSFDTLAATCTPAGRGACPASGIWKPRGRAAGPRFASMWLNHEQELAARIDAIGALLDACRASTGDYTLCRTAEVEDLLAWDRLALPMHLDLQPARYYVRGTALSATTLVLTMHEDGIPERSCSQPNPALVGVCAGEAW